MGAITSRLTTPSPPRFVIHPRPNPHRHEHTHLNNHELCDDCGGYRNANIKIADIGKYSVVASVPFNTARKYNFPPEYFVSNSGLHDDDEVTDDESEEMNEEDARYVEKHILGRTHEAVKGLPPSVFKGIIESNKVPLGQKKLAHSVDESQNDLDPPVYPVSPSNEASSSSVTLDKMPNTRPFPNIKPWSDVPIFYSHSEDDERSVNTMYDGVTRSLRADGGLGSHSSANSVRDENFSQGSELLTASEETSDGSSDIELDGYFSDALSESDQVRTLLSSDDEKDEDVDEDEDTKETKRIEKGKWRAVDEDEDEEAKDSRRIAKRKREGSNKGEDERAEKRHRTAKVKRIAVAGFEVQDAEESQGEDEDDGGREPTSEADEGEMATGRSWSLKAKGKGRALDEVEDEDGIHADTEPDSSSHTKSPRNSFKPPHRPKKRRRRQISLDSEPGAFAHAYPIIEPPDIEPPPLTNAERWEQLASEYRQYKYLRLTAPETTPPLVLTQEIYEQIVEDINDYGLSRPPDPGRPNWMVYVKEGLFDPWPLGEEESKRAIELNSDAWRFSIGSTTLTRAWLDMGVIPRNNWTLTQAGLRDATPPPVDDTHNSTATKRKHDEVDYEQETHPTSKRRREDTEAAQDNLGTGPSNSRNEETGDDEGQDGEVVLDPSRFYVWLDIETTDPSRNISDINIFEIAVLVTNENFEPLDEGLTILVHEPELSTKSEQELIHILPYQIFQTHKRSGLLSAWLQVDPSEQVSLSGAEQSICSYLKAHGLGPDGVWAVMAGSGVAFDRAMVKHHMPTLNHHFSMQTFDVISIWRLVKHRYGIKERLDEGAASGHHRAIDNIKNAIREASLYSSAVLREPAEAKWPSSSQ